MSAGPVIAGHRYAFDVIWLTSGSVEAIHTVSDG